MSTKHTLDSWKVMADPDHEGMHEFHDNRYVVTANAEVFRGYDERSWALNKGEIICRVTDYNTKEKANLLAAAPYMLSALKEAQELIQKFSKKAFGKEYSSFAVEQAIKKAEGMEK